MSRRIDGKGWNCLRKFNEDTGQWSEPPKSRTWSKYDGDGKRPVGAELLRTSLARASLVILCEGFPDMLAAYQLLWDYAGNLPPEQRTVVINLVCIVAMVCAAPLIAEDALPLFKGRRVIIAAQRDLKPDGSNPGEDAAQKWAKQLHGAGATVLIHRLADANRLPEGGKDLADAARWAWERQPAHADNAGNRLRLNSPKRCSAGSERAQRIAFAKRGSRKMISHTHDDKDARSGCGQVTAESEQERPLTLAGHKARRPPRSLDPSAGPRRKSSRNSSRM